MTDTHVALTTIGGDRGADAMRMASDLAQLRGLPIEIRSYVTDDREIEPRREALERLSASVSESVPVTVKVARARETGEAVALTPNDVFSCIATSAKHLPHEGHVGSYAERLLRYADNPVVVLGPHASPELSALDRVVVPVDGSALAERAVTVGADLAKLMSAELWIISVIDASAQHQAEAAGVTIESGYVRRLAQPHNGQFEVMHGSHVAERIIDFAQSDSLIVMSSHGRTGFDRLIAGSVAMAVIAESCGPVVVVPPKAEVS